MVLSGQMDLYLIAHISRSFSGKVWKPLANCVIHGVESAWERISRCLLECIINPAHRAELRGGFNQEGSEIYHLKNVPWLAYQTIVIV